jgi:hypothetical protein
LFLGAFSPIQSAMAWGRFDGGHHPAYGGGWAHQPPVVVHNNYIEHRGGGCVGCGIGVAAVAGLIGGAVIGAAIAGNSQPQTVVVQQPQQVYVQQGRRFTCRLWHNECQRTAALSMRTYLVSAILRRKRRLLHRSSGSLIFRGQNGVTKGLPVYDGKPFF